ncbi:MAG: tetratricopeptide repeat protein [Candidatus Obscuribacterales bacterium]|nr:tetratricopeptide repeat protein [Candidatus Obscuribacterales bacterium]
MFINRTDSEHIKRLKARTNLGAICLLLSLALTLPANALPFGKDKDEEPSPDLVPKIKLSKEQETEFNTSLKNGQAYVKQGNFELAQICFMRCTTLNPSSSDAHLGLAYCHVGLKHNEQAMVEVFEALRCEPNKIETRFLLGDIMMKDARWDEAGGQYLQILKQSPDDLAARGNLATCLQMMGQIEPAIGQYKYILEKDPKSSMAAFNLAAAYEQKNMVDEAAIYYKKVVELDPNNAFAYCSLAKCLAAKKDFKAAQVLLNYVKSKLGANNHYLHLVQGYVNEGLGDKRGAIEEYTKAVALNPNDGDSKSSLTRLLNMGNTGGRVNKPGNLSGLKSLSGLTPIAK